MKYIKVLNSVICLDCIKKAETIYYAGTNYQNESVHRLNIVYKDGGNERFETTDYILARQNFEALKSVLLNIDDSVEVNDEYN